MDLMILHILVNNEVDKEIILAVPRHEFKYDLVD